MYVILYIFSCQLSGAAEIAANILLQEVRKIPRRRIMKTWTGIAFIAGFPIATTWVALNYLNEGSVNRAR